MIAAAHDVKWAMLTIRTKRTLRGLVPMCAFGGKATTHSQFLASDKFCVALRDRIYLGHRQIIKIRCVAPLFVLTIGTSVGALMPMRMLRH